MGLVDRWIGIWSAQACLRNAGASSSTPKIRVVVCLVRSFPHVYYQLASVFGNANHASRPVLAHEWAVKCIVRREVDGLTVQLRQAPGIRVEGEIS